MTISKKTMVAIALSAMVATTAFATTAEALPKLKFPPPDTSIKTPILNIEDMIDDGQSDDPVLHFPKPKPKPIYVPLPPGIFKKGQKETLEVLLDCKIAGAGDDMWLVNFGSDEIPAGLKIRYSVPSTGDHGAFLLPQGIDAGKKIKISDLLHGAEDGAPCRVQIIQ